MVDQEKADLLCRVDFPLYSATMISPRHILLAGGGGSANTGVKNGFEIFEITTNGEQCTGTSVTRYFTDDHAVMTLSARPITNNNMPLKVLLAAGHDQYCQVYSLSLARDRKTSERGDSGVRLRNGAPGQRPPTSQEGSFEEAKFVFKTESLRRVQTDFHEKEPYCKVVRISCNGKLLASGGDDGNVRIWSFPELSKVHEFTTHEKEVDDVDFSPDSGRICSISKDRRAIVWDVKKGKKHAELGWETPNNVKYMFKRVKFACVEGDIKRYKVFTISNPIGSSKAPSVLHRWNTQSYTTEDKVASFGITYSALAVSDNGNFVATGTMSEGIVDIFASYNLQRLKRVRNSHSTFITGLEFLPTSEDSAACRGFSDASVVSISVDHQVCIHHVAKLATVSSLTGMVLVVLVLLGAFLLAGYLGL